MKKIILSILILMTLASCAKKEESSFISKDDSDPPNGSSGLNLYTDNLTGCQYLSQGYSLTPRMDEYGRQICKKAQ